MEKWKVDKKGQPMKPVSQWTQHTKQEFKWPRFVAGYCQNNDVPGIEDLRKWGQDQAVSVKIIPNHSGQGTL